MSFLNHILRYRHVDLTNFVPVYVGHEQIGWTKQDFAQLLGRFPDTWQFADDRLTLNPALEGFVQMSHAVHEVFLAISAQGHYPPLPDYSHMGGDDWLPVGQERWTNPLFQVHRFYSVCLGVRRESVMVHGVEDDKMWLAVRGSGVDEHVNQYDMIVSGCMTIGQSYHDALLKEGGEECGLTEDILPHVKRGSQLYTMYHTASGFLMDEIFNVFDLDTKNTFTPKVVKELEVSHFELLPIQHVLDLVGSNGPVKPHISFILVDFFIRFGYLKPDMPSYARIVDELSNPYSFPIL